MLNPTADSAPTMSGIVMLDGKLSTIDVVELHAGADGSPNICRATVDLPAPDGPTMSPTLHGRASIGTSPDHVRLVLSFGGASNIAQACRMRGVTGWSHSTETLTIMPSMLLDQRTDGDAARFHFGHEVGLLDLVGARDHELVDQAATAAALGLLAAPWFLDGPGGE